MISALVILVKNIKNVVEKDNMTEQNFKDMQKQIENLEKDNLRMNGAQVECFVRINSLEVLLFKKGIISEKEYEDAVRENIEKFGAAMEAQLKLRIDNNSN